MILTPCLLGPSYKGLDMPGGLRRTFCGQDIVVTKRMSCGQDIVVTKRMSCGQDIIVTKRMSCGQDIVIRMTCSGQDIILTLDILLYFELISA
jgi:hypothetical protein